MDDWVGETLNRLEGHKSIRNECVSYGTDHLNPVIVSTGQDKEFPGEGS